MSSGRLKNFFIPFLFITTFLFARNAFATLPDSTEGSLRISANFHYGFVIAHRPLLVPLQKAHVTGFDVQLAIPTTGKKPWERTYIHPVLGINYSWFDLGNSIQLGHGHTLYPFILFPLNSNPHLQLNIRFGAGIGYVEKIYDRYENYKNQAIASHVNAIFAVHAAIYARLARRTFFQTTVGVTHFSNGSMDIPNLGINIATLSGGISYYLGDKKPVNRDPVVFSEKKRRTSIMISGSIKEVYPPEGPKFLAGSLSYLESLRVGKKSAFGLAADVFYDNSIHVRLIEDSIHYNGPEDQLRVGLAGSYELIVSDLSLLLQTGGYFYNKLKSDGDVYSRFGIRYSLAKNYFVCFNLKTHFAKADFFEWGGGVKF
jgi:hypothetical protein